MVCFGSGVPPRTARLSMGVPPLTALRSGRVTGEGALTGDLDLFPAAALEGAERDEEPRRAAGRLSRCRLERRGLN